MPFYAIRSEAKNRNAKVRQRRAAARALDHDQTLDEWGPESGFQTATERVRGQLRALTRDGHFHTNHRALSERDVAVSDRRRMVGDTPAAAGRGEEE